jgi:predicted ATPase/DNA-binding CsgD family transcriptional regulator
MIRSDVPGYAQTYAIPFVGRKTELDDIANRLHNPECRLLTITGLGGSGKTRLAVEAARLAAPSFAQGAAFTALQPLTRSDLLIPTIAQAVGMTFYGARDLREQLLAFLREKNMLLVLDNFEHLLDGAELVNDILAGAPGVKLLVTSREALNLREEWLYPLKGLSTPHSVYSTALEDYEAVQLFRYHAQRVQPSFDPLVEHESIIRICQMTAGLPLALELAASWLKGLPVAQVAAEMQHNLDFLSTNTRNIEERHRSMRAVFDKSWDLLAENERQIFARLSVFAGGFDRDSAAAVAEASFTDLAALVEKSLVQMVSAERFGIHELLRQYATEQLGNVGEIEATYARHAAYFARFVERHEAGFKRPDQVASFQAVERDFENIRRAWDWSARNGANANLHAMVNGLYLFGFLRSRYREITTMFQHTLDESGGRRAYIHEISGIFQNALDQSISDEALYGRMLTRRWGYLHWGYDADYELAFGSIERALAIAQAENNAFETALAHLMAAYVMISTERYAEALPHLENSKGLFESIDEPYYVCWVLHRLGYVYYNLNQSIKGMDYTEQSLTLARATHNRVAWVICLYNLGSDYIMIGDYVKGKQYCAEALQVATEGGHQDQIAHALSLLALCAFCQGDYVTCQDYAERSQTIIEDINSLIFEPYSLSLLILMACLREDYEQAARLNKVGIGRSTNKMGLQMLHWSLAVLACAVGNATDVREHIDKVLEHYDQGADDGSIIWLLPCVVYLLAESDREKAVELMAWAYTQPDMALDWVRRWPFFNRLRDKLQADMDASTYARCWAKGEALEFEAVKDFVEREFLPAADDDAILTEREREILNLMAAGMTNPQIAAQLVIGAGTVKTHTLNIYRKLDVANRTQAIQRGRERGLIQE